MYKVLIFLKRRQDLTPEAFRDYYEQQHGPLCQKYMQGVARYTRRYLDPVANPDLPGSGDVGFDVVTEVWFDDREAYEGMLKYAARGILPDEIIADEEKLFDRSQTRFCTVLEYDTPMAS